MYTGAVMEGIDSISGSVPIIGTTEDKPVKISAEKSAEQLHLLITKKETTAVYTSILQTVYLI